MTELADLPKTIERWCCSWGKSCGLTTLELTVDAEVHEGPVAVLVYAYERGNGDYFIKTNSLESLAEWVKETELDPEEVRKHNEAYGADE